ncbi:MULTISPECIES: hypothetical protein [unclassified Curtobacterium]|uniref:hypothetical protein n=1 Tax=unclassified Curtobacterium TaxID=257496 RepID=UPI00226B0CD9|nr:MULTISPECIES: hypothetical protein [unclassified Curtobacterium]
MADEIDFINDGDGVAIIGEASAVDRFLVSNGLESRGFDLPKLSQAYSIGSGAAGAGAEIAANAGRWVKLTKDSAKAMQHSSLMKGSSAGVSRAVLTDGGKIKGLLEITKASRSLLTNPAILTGAAGIMAQLAMQQAMDEITDYLATINAKLDDVLRAQKDASLADMIGVDLVIADALRMRDSIGSVGEITWSKVQGTEFTIARTQAYALRQLDALAEKLERTTKVKDLAEASSVAEATVQEWLAVLARCFQLQDGLAVLELDRVLETAPDQLDRHRRALRLARQERKQSILRSTERLVARMDDAAGIADLKIVLHPKASRALVQSTNHVADGVEVFHDSLGIERERRALEATRWRDAADAVADGARDKALELGEDGVDLAKRLSGDAIEHAASAAGALSSGLAGIAGRLRRQGTADDDGRLPERSAPSPD